MHWLDVKLCYNHLKSYFKDKRCNIGIKCGFPSNLVVLNFNKKDAFKKWSKEHPDIIDRTQVVRKSKKKHWNCHLYFALDSMTSPPAPCKADGVELLSNGNFVIAPPSSTTTDGEYYFANNKKALKWDDTYTPTNLIKNGDVNALPTYTQEICDNSISIPSLSVLKIITGVKDNTQKLLFEWGCQLRDAGVSLNQAIMICTIFNNNSDPNIDPNIEDELLIRCVENAYKYPSYKAKVLLPGGGANKGVRLL